MNFNKNINVFYCFNRFLNGKYIKKLFLPKKTNVISYLFFYIKTLYFKLLLVFFKMNAFRMLLVLLVSKIFCFNQSLRQNLTISLFENYNKAIRPNEKVNVSIAFSLRQILSIDEKDQTMISNIFFYQAWIDERFTWNISSGSPYEGIKTIIIPAKDIWSPDSFILNTVDSTGFFDLHENHLASIGYNGWVVINFPLTILKTRCDIQTKLFPFDTQMCPIALTSWMYQSNQLQYNIIQALDIDQYQQNSIWSLVGVNYVIQGDTSRWSLENHFFGESILSPKK
jgi:hypothetical protein